MAEEDGERDYGLTAAQRAVKGRYPAIQRKYAYLDHTADVQLHAWGDTLEEAFEQCAMAMFGYMTDTETVEPLDTVEVEAEGHDMLSLLFNFLNEWLYKFSAEEFFIPRVGRRVLFAEASPGDRSQSNHVFSHAGSGRRKTRSFCHNRYLKKGGEPVEQQESFSGGAQKPVGQKQLWMQIQAAAIEEIIRLTWQ
ncbi:protein archease isoform X1 [Crotalus tigris]|uniref:protein archease isoform X1 n=1 Tax=Crotalus tigris TaxID=88082 RepID=UPI00192F1C5B|nr:protein archease isoform X1 [Crotalus tigris]